MIASAAGVEEKENDASSGDVESTVGDTGQENLSRSDSGVHIGGERGDWVEAPVKFSKYVIHVLCINFYNFCFSILPIAGASLSDKESSVNFW